VKKSFGQHFLKDTTVVDQIIAAADIQSNELVIEVGPGAGALTGQLEGRGSKLVLIESDRDLLPGLASKFSGSTRIQADAAEVDYDAIVHDRSWVFVSNLPYNAGNAILETVLRSKNLPNRLVIMVQKEVGERMMAKPGDMSVLSVATQLYCTIESICTVGPEAFSPPPKVDSTVLRLSPKSSPHSCGDRGGLEAIIALAKIGFSHRRKQLRQTLAQGIGASLEVIDAALAKIGVEKSVRPQELSIAQWTELRQLL
jgi:16S rRNA (adenine1518-N6/adenine1519-N6)-dimethyltransferase